MDFDPTTTGKEQKMDQSRWFSEEVQPHEAALRSYLHDRFPTVETDEIVQESYFKLLQIRGKTEITKAKAYLFSVAKHTAQRIFRRRRQLYSEIPINKLSDWQLLDNGPDGAEIANAHERLDLVAEAVDRLPARCRAIIRLAVVDGHSAIEIAERLCLSESTVRVQLARGIKRCSEYLRERNEAR